MKEAEQGVQLKALLIAAKTDCVLVGDSEGQVTVYKIQNLKVGDSDPVSVAVVPSGPSEQLVVSDRPSTETVKYSLQPLMERLNGIIM